MRILRAEPLAPSPAPQCHCRPPGRFFNVLPSVAQPRSGSIYGMARGSGLSLRMGSRILAPNADHVSI